MSESEYRVVGTIDAMIRYYHEKGLALVDYLAHNKIEYQIIE